MEDDDLFGLPIPTPTVPVGNAPPTAEPASRLPFGFIARSTTLLGLHDGGNVEIVRTVSGGVEYRQPPLAIVWSKASSYKYVLIWPTNPAQHPLRTLESLGKQLQDLRTSRGLISKDDPALAVLDTGIDAYLKTVERLHAQHWTQGLIHPGAVVFTPIGGVETAILPDLGFRWDGEIGEPDWLTDHPGATLWNEPATVRQLAWSQSLSAEAKQADTVVAAKVIAQSLLGRQPYQADLAINLPFWVTLRDALDGRFSSVAEFRQALASTPASQHFSLKPEKKLPTADSIDTKPAKSVPFVGIAVSLLLLAGLAAFLLLSGNKPPLDSNGEPIVKGPDGKPSSTEAIVTSTGTSSGTGVALGTAGSPKLPIPVKLPDASGSLVQQAQNIVRLPTGPAADAARDQYAGRWFERVRQIKGSIDPQSGRGMLVAKRELNELVTALQEIRARPTSNGTLTEKEKKCLDYSQELLRKWDSSPR